MGQESKTGVSDEFKALEMEMALRHEGMLVRSARMADADPTQVWRNYKSP